MRLRQLVYVDDPHPTSRAASVLLRRQLQVQSKPSWLEWLEFRDAHLAEVKTEKGDLVCHYCGQPGLQESVGESPTKEDMRILATLDHVQALANGGAEYDKKNLVVACYPCNQLKADKENFGYPYFMIDMGIRRVGYRL